MLGDSSSTVFCSFISTATLSPDSGWEEISVNGASLRPGAGDLLHSSPGGSDEEVTVSWEYTGFVTSGSLIGGE